MDAVYTSIKKVLPVPIRNAIGLFRVYIRRTRYVAMVYRSLRGRSSEDQALVRAGCAGFLRGLLKQPGVWREVRVSHQVCAISKRVGCFQIRAESDDIGHVLLGHDRELYSALERLLRPGDTMIDAGANIGGVSVFAAGLVGSHGKVISIEMIPETADQLELNIELNRAANVAVVRKALTNQSEAFVTARVSPSHFGQASLEANVPSDLRDMKRELLVPTTTLDDISSEFGDIRLLKLDLEGHELPALEGALNTLSKIEHVIFECWGNGESAAETLLRNTGFSVEKINARNRLASRSNK